MCMQLKKRSEGDRKGPTTGNSSSGTDYKSSISVELSRVDSRFKSNSNNFDIKSEILASSIKPMTLSLEIHHSAIATREV